MIAGHLRAKFEAENHRVNKRDEVTEAAVAWLLDVSIGTLRNMRTQKRSPPFRKLPSGVFFPVDELAEWLNSIVEGGDENRFTHLHGNSRTEKAPA